MRRDTGVLCTNSVKSSDEVKVLEMTNQSFLVNVVVGQTNLTLAEREGNAEEEYKILLNFVSNKLWHEIMV